MIAPTAADDTTNHGSWHRQPQQLAEPFALPALHTRKQWLAHREILLHTQKTIALHIAKQQNRLQAFWQRPRFYHALNVAAKGGNTM
ncbi:MAG TPA: hypothetical protein VIQ97_03545 [Prevotella sp.]